jgi:hypothetical protein
MNSITGDKSPSTYEIKFHMNSITGDKSPSTYEIKFPMNSITGDTRILLIIKSIPNESYNWRQENPSNYETQSYMNFKTTAFRFLPYTKSFSE